MPKILASLGMSCQTAHQLSRFADAFPQKAVFQKGPFDWLICPPGHAAHWLRSGLEGFELSDIISLHGHAWWPRHEFWFWHGFFTKSEEKPALEIEKNFERERAKLAHQRHRFVSLDPDNTIFVVSNIQNNLETEVFGANESHRFSFRDASIADLQSALDEYFQCPTSLLVVSRQDWWCDGHNPQAKHHMFEPDESEWKGCDAQWNALLSSMT